MYSFVQLMGQKVTYENENRCKVVIASSCRERGNPLDSNQLFDSKEIASSEVPTRNDTGVVPNQNNLSLRALVKSAAIPLTQIRF